MKKLMLGGLVGLLLLVLGACGGTAQPAPTATSTPAARAAPAATTAPTTQAVAPVSPQNLASLVRPGALGENITLELLTQYSWIFESPYYKSLLQKAKLDNPTPLTTKGQKFEFQYTCINRTLLPCKLMESYYIPNVLQRTDGQVKIQVIGYPELSIAGPETLRLVADGTTAFSEITGAYVGGQLPVLDLYYLWGLYPSREADFNAVTTILPDLDKSVSEATGGGVVLHHNVYAGNDQFFFSRRPLLKTEDFKGLKTRSHGTTMSDLINGLGGEAQFVAFAETYTALERGILDAAASGATAGYGLRWYEVAKYIWGPVISMPMDMIVMNKSQWAKLPPDIQQILIEEGAKQEMENLRLAPEWNETGLAKNTAAGMAHNPITPELYQFIIDEVVINKMVPNWVNRVGGPNSAAVALFNQKVAPIAKIKIESDGKVVKTGEIKITTGQR